MESALTALPFLAFLACPLMMLFCLVGMRKMGCSTPRTTAGQTREAGIIALQDQLTAVQSELAALRAAAEQSTADRFLQTIGSDTTCLPQTTRVVRVSA